MNFCLTTLDYYTITAYCIVLAANIFFSNYYVMLFKGLFCNAEVVVLLVVMDFLSHTTLFWQ